MKNQFERLTNELFPVGVGIASHMVSQMYGLPPARNGVKVERNIEVIARDGIVLKTDIYTPKSPGPHPSLMMRTPYGRFGFGMVAKIYAERGFRTILQACRGTDGSGGTFDPLINERDDGLASLDWIKAQSWFDGRLGLTGPSYLGFAQWAICDALPDGAVLSAKSTASDFEQIVFPGGTFSLQLWLSWLQTVHGLENELFGMTLRMATGDVERRTNAAALTLPLIEADIATIGEKVPFWRQWFEKAIDSPPFWRARSHTSRLNEKTPPNCFVTGWFDLMLDGQLADYQRLVTAGHTPHLTIGRWAHADNELQRECLRQTLSWMSAHLLDETDALRKKPVRIYVSGSRRWLECETFPPSPTQNKTLYLGDNGALLENDNPAPAHDRYTYDPANPTPNVGGAIFAFGGAGSRDNRELEARPDVLTYTTPFFTENLTVIGNVKVALFITSSLSYTDFFVRMCDVDAKGISTNIADTIIRLTPDRFTPDEQGLFTLNLSLHATAHTFLAGHQLRLQVSSGAHPRFARNFGTDEPIGSAIRMQSADQKIFRGPPHSSAIILPVVELEAIS